MTDPRPPPRVSAARLALGVGAIATLTAVGVWWAAPSTAELRAAFVRLSDIGPAAIALLAALVVAYIGAEALRIAVIGRLCGLRVGARAAIDASITGHFFSAVAPGAAIGEGAAAFTLARHGVPLHAAVLIPFAKLASSFAVAYGAAAVLLWRGYGPPGATWATGWFALFIGTGPVITVGLFVLTAVRPALATRAVDAAHRRLGGWIRRPRLRGWLDRLAGGLRRAIERLTVLGGHGLGGVLAILAVNVVYYAIYVAPMLVLCAHAGDAPWPDVAARGLLFLCLLFAAPTPGGAGIGEASAVWFLGDLVPPADAVAVAALYRLITSHLHVAIGSIYVPWRAWRGPRVT